MTRDRAGPSDRHDLGLAIVGRRKSAIRRGIALGTTAPRPRGAYSSSSAGVDVVTKSASRAHSTARRAMPLRDQHLVGGMTEQNPRHDCLTGMWQSASRPQSACAARSARRSSCGRAKTRRSSAAFTVSTSA